LVRTTVTAVVATAVTTVTAPLLGSSHDVPLSYFACRRLQRQALFAGAFGDRCDPSVVLVSASVEDGCSDTCRLCSFGNQFAYPTRLRRLVIVRGPQVGLHGRGRRQRVPGFVVDHLDHHVPQGPGD